jgi:hypothetical protein
MERNAYKRYRHPCLLDMGVPLEHRCQLRRGSHLETDEVVRAAEDEIPQLNLVYLRAFYAD